MSIIEETYGEARDPLVFNMFTHLGLSAPLMAGQIGGERKEGRKREPLKSQIFPLDGIHG
jgi:hypothetical protein